MKGTRFMRALATAMLLLALWTGCERSATEGAIEASGTIEATEANVATKIGGIIVAIDPDEGTPVDSGATIARIDHRDLDWQLSQALATVEAARANLALAVNGARREDVAHAAATVRQARVQVDAARTDLDRTRRLHEAGSATTKQFDDATSRVDAGEAALDAAQANLDRLHAGTRREQVDAARAQVAQAEAQANLLRSRIEDATIRAPFAGIMTERLMEPGEMAPPGAGIATITRLDPVFLKVYLSEVDLGRIALGQTVDVYLDAAPDTARKGRVSYISPSAEFTPKNVQTKDDRVKLVFAVEIALDNANGLLKPGLPADAVFAASRADTAGRTDAR